jgi:tRNA G18 (ribose-2'-O)-methylase SpoU
VVGNEVEGIEEGVRVLCDDLVEIPMLGKKESLNVSVATGIALYKLVQK